MLERVFAELGPWNWMVLGFALLTLEILTPGVFMLWIGLAALIVGALSLMFWSAGFWVWQVQILVFLALALVCAFAGKKIMSGRGSASDQPLLNRRGDQLIGRTATLTEPITDGRGRIKIGDTTWRVSGPDLPAGTKVRVKAAADLDLELVVEPV
ncbi:NfeD family protein [Mesorhizobium sp. YM1C-6-2]|uniref:NfeD family protein n=1 Tax=Mesorhizobium sp. YM1C-6-2 TaxID=1827501 RepID=UPI000EF211FE|nr:NfeD family protein [Mesorhizobium sp. YM1C-6-2]RLP26890.1 NfeD family protein [Mesorhizobium sp. YM1C-6-2]